MHSQRVKQDQRTALIVADDSGILSILNRVLAGKGYRVLMALGADSAVRLLHHEIWIDTVLIRDGLRGANRIERRCRRREIEVLPFRRVDDDQIIRLRLPEARICSEIVYAPRILVVEGRPDVRSLFDRVLAEDGYLVTCVSTGHQALEVARKVTFDAVVVDVSLPDMDGSAVILQIRSEFPWVGTLPVAFQMTTDIPDMAHSSEADELRMAVYRLLDPAERWKPSGPLGGRAAMALTAAS
jgi:CheY-like chemotaxis protein